jgi:hypothetical protein
MYFNDYYFHLGFIVTLIFSFIVFLFTAIYFLLTKDKRFAKIKLLPDDRKEKLLKGNQHLIKIIKIYLWALPFAFFVTAYLGYGHPSFFQFTVLSIMAYILLVELFIILRISANEINMLKNDKQVPPLKNP